MVGTKTWLAFSGFWGGIARSGLYCIFGNHDQNYRLNGDTATMLFIQSTISVLENGGLMEI